MWDVVSAAAPDYFLANSEFVRARIQKFYRRPATVIYPPVDVHRFRPLEDKDDFYLTVSRSVPYKRVPLIVEAFRRISVGKRRRRLHASGPGVHFRRPRRLRDRARGSASVWNAGHRLRRRRRRRDGTRSRLCRTSDGGVLRGTDIERDHRRRRSLRAKPGRFLGGTVSRQRAAILSRTLPGRIRRLRQPLSRTALARSSTSATHSSRGSGERMSSPG
jgi:hypothetical protein